MEEDRDVTPELLLRLFMRSKELSGEFAEKFNKLKPAAEYLRKVLQERTDKGKKEGVFCKLPEPDVQIVAYAIDTSFLASPLNLVYGDLVLFTAGYIRFPRANISDSKVNRLLDVHLDLVAKGFVTSFSLSIMSHKFERRIALKLLEKKEKGEEGFDFNAIFVDGPILPLPLPPPRTSGVGDLIAITEEVIERARKLEVSIIGVVKRVRSRILARVFLSEKDEFEEIAKEANDKALAMLMLKKGEALYLGRLEPGSMLIKGVVRNEELIDKLEEFVEDHPWLKEMDYFLLKPKNSEQPVTVEVLDFAGLGAEKIVSWINEHSSVTGCPHFLDAVDMFVKVEPSVVEVARRVLVRYAIKAIGDPNVINLLEHADLQNKFSPRKMG